MNHSLFTGRQENPWAFRRSYQARQKTLLRRFIGVSVFVHLTVLSWPNWQLSAPDPLTVPSLQILLQQSAALEPVSTVQPHGSSLRSREALPPIASAPLQTHAGLDGAGSDSIATSSDTERLNHLQTLLRGALDRQFVYPSLARRHGWQGKVELGAELDANGRLQNMRVLRSSGYSILDDDALATLARIGELPQARPWLSGHSFRIALPVVYRLVEG